MRNKGWKYNYQAELIRVIDGDTVVLNIDLGMNGYRKASYRLYGINAPEHGVPATKALRGFLEDPTISVMTVNTYKADKYGRYMVEILLTYTDGSTCNVNKKLLELGLVVEYYGGKR